MLGKEPAGSEVIATPANFTALLSIFNAMKDNQEAANESLRCIANALLLISDGRQIFVQKDVGGGEAMVDLLEKSTSPERIFLASRILFLATVSMACGEFIRNLVEGKLSGHHSNIVDIISSKLDSLLGNILASEKMAKEAMSDLLKMTFNLLLHYPKMVDTSSGVPDDEKVMGDCWSEKLDGVLPSLLRLFNTLPPTFPAPLAPPMTQVIHSLITVPVTPSLRSKWFPPLSNPGSPRTTSTSKPSTPIGSPPAPDSPTSRSESPAGKDGKEVKSGAFDRAFAKLTVSRKSIHRSVSPHSQAGQDTLLRAYDLLDVTLAHNLPGNVEADDKSVRERCREESDSDLDDLVCPLVILITKLCNADEGARKRMRGWLLPDDLDRTNPLEERSDLLGRCLRLLQSIHHNRLKDATGEMLYAICESDASTLSSYVGYGNVAGFLFNKGVLSAPPPVATGSAAAGAPDATADGRPINPITGVVQRDDPTPQMTDEEKEREAEKLFVLFDRLERSGAIDPNQNPVRKAIASGKGPAY
ncbi:hypothetical protein EIP86_001728 [Pleurotus ostreatoroseus]|nr:hypothetical protein EIP86_001728 [Pleurotus ostreatoroseus]